MAKRVLGVELFVTLQWSCQQAKTFVEVLALGGTVFAKYLLLGEGHHLAAEES